MSRYQATHKRAAQWRFCLLAAGCGALSLLVQRPLAGQEVAAPPGDVSQGQEQVIPLDSGPIHEAFAEPVTLATEVGIVVQQQPPEPVPELPPETQPQGSNVVWVPGYWAWSDDRDDFIWISGVWRDMPPHQQWVPGYWTQVADGYQWVRGFWTSEEAEELVYLPAPPESLETEPTAPQPGPDHFWVPGSWRWQDNQYYWRGGFWHPAQENWLWVPANYRYTPRGYVYTSGYWDYPLQQRGLLFSPVYFPGPFYQRGGYFFTPNSWINTALLTTSLFVAPRYGHYYYGNYYGPQYLSAGYYPWFDYHNRPFGYDPLFAYSSWRHGGRDSDWFVNLRQGYRQRAEGIAAERDRPDVTREPRQPDLRDRPGVDRDRDQTRLVRRLDELREARGENLTRIDDAQRRQAVEQSQRRFGDLRRQRAEAELPTGREARPDRDRLRQDRGPGAEPRDRELPQQDRRPGDRARRSPAEQGDRPRADQPGRGDTPPQQQPQAERPQQDRPQVGQPQQRDQPRVDRRDQPREQRPGADRRIESRPAGPINGRFQLPPRAQQQPGARGADRPPAAGSPQQRGQQLQGQQQGPQPRGQRIGPQVPQRPGGVDRQRPGPGPQQPARGIQPRGDSNPGAGPAGAGPRQAPQNRGDRGGGAPRGNRGQSGDDDN